MNTQLLLYATLLCTTFTNYAQSHWNFQIISGIHQKRPTSVINNYESNSGRQIDEFNSIS